MLYALHEMRHAWLAPWNTVAAAHRDLLTNPFSPLAYLPSSRRVAAGFDLFCRVTQRYEKPEFGLTSTLVDGREVAVEERVAIEKPFCRLLHFRRDAARADPAVLLVAPLSGHFATLLRDTVRTLLPDHDVYVTDWVDAKHGAARRTAPFHLDDYVDYVREFIRFLGPDAARDLGLPADGAGARGGLADGGGRRAGAPRTMTMMGGPIDTRAEPDRGEQPRDAAAAVAGSSARSIQRVPDEVPGLHAPRLSRGSCSTSASSR